MAQHHLKCTVCGAVERDVDISVTVGARLYCQTHWCVAPVVMDDTVMVCQGRLEPIPGIGRMSVFGEFAKFTTPIEDPSSPTGFRDVTISTLGDIRRLERESEQAERNGDGRRMIWRDYSQDHSNRDTHTMGEAQYETPAKNYLNGRPVEIRRGDPVTADHGTVEE